MFGRKYRQQIFQLTQERDKWMARCKVLLDEADAQRNRLKVAVPPVERAKLEEALGVDADNPVLQAVLFIIRDMRGEAARNSAVSQKLDVKEGYYDGSLGYSFDLESEILDLAEAGRRKKAGQKK